MSLFWKCVALSAVCLTGGVSAQAPTGWSLVWADEFDQPDGSPPDPEKWGFDTGGGGWGNNELQYYTSRPENVRIEDGHLVIEAREEEYEGKDYTSARLLTKDRHTWTYGRFEARIRLPRGQGIWPAFWLLGASVDAIGWPHCGEIDIMENIGSAPSTVHGTVHGPGYSGAGGVSGHHVLEGAALADDFRVFAVEWEENRIRWFIDGHLYFTLTPAGLPPGREWVFHHAHFLLLNVAVGGNWPGSPDAGTEFPQRMLVDYVRVYARDGDGGQEANLLANPGFETGLAEWTVSGGNVYPESDVVRGGTGSAKIFGQFNGAANESGMHQEAAAEPGAIYRADVWLFTPADDRIAGGNSAWAEVSFHDPEGEVLGLFRSAAMTSASPANLWRRFPVNLRVDSGTGGVLETDAALEAPPGTATLRKRLVFRQVGNAAGSVRFDDAVLFEVEEDAPEGVEVTVDPGAPWLGYMNVWNLPANGGGYLSGSVWATEELRSSFSGPVLTLAPNTIADPSTYWYVGGGGPGSPGAKIMEANLYVERTGDFSGKEVTFTGRVLSNDLTAAHTSVAFIKDFAPDYSSFNMVSAPLEEGVFRITLSTNPSPGRHVQYGFQTTGPNVWHTDAAPFGSVTVSAVAADPFSEWISGFDFSAFADPDLSREGDPDGDGLSNLTEFAVNGNPAGGEAGGKLRHRIEELADGRALVLTLPVRAGAVFTGSPGKSASIDGMNYLVEGSRELAVFDRQVVELPSAMAEGMPAPGDGWSYRSFRLDGAVGEANPAGFLRLRVVAAQ